MAEAPRMQSAAVEGGDAKSRIEIGGSTTRPTETNPALKAASQALAASGAETSGNITVEEMKLKVMRANPENGQTVCNTDELLIVIAMLSDKSPEDESPIARLANTVYEGLEASYQADKLEVPTINTRNIRPATARREFENLLETAQDLAPR